MNIGLLTTYLMSYVFHEEMLSSLTAIWEGLHIWEHYQAKQVQIITHLLIHSFNEIILPWINMTEILALNNKFDHHPKRIVLMDKAGQIN